MTREMPGRYARVAGSLYLVIIVAGLFAQFARESLVVWSDAAATAHNVASSPFLLRSAIAADLLTFVLAIPVTVIFYLLLRPVDKSLALLAVLLNLVQDSVGAVNALNTYRPLQLLGGARYLRVVPEDQLQAMALLSFRSHAVGFAIALLFFGICCAVLGLLIYRSGFFPKVLGVMLAVAGICYVLNTLAELLAPSLSGNVSVFLLLPAFVGELSLSVWLVVKGVHVDRWWDRAATPDLQLVRIR